MPHAFACPAGTAAPHPTPFTCRLPTSLSFLPPHFPFLASLQTSSAGQTNFLQVPTLWDGPAPPPPPPPPIAAAPTWRGLLHAAFHWMPYRDGLQFRDGGDCTCRQQWTHVWYSPRLYVFRLHTCPHTATSALTPAVHTRLLLMRRRALHHLFTYACCQQRAINIGGRFSRRILDICARACRALACLPLPG